MASTKRIKNSLLIASFGILLSGLAVGTLRAYADTETPDDSELTPEQSDAIMQNCGNIKQSLTKLQRSDSRTRTYLGSAYEAIAGKFITPLNLRLVKNGLPSTDLFQIQNSFTSTQAEFRNEYVEYMRELEALIAVDCVLHPQDFYDKLNVVRERRSKLQATTQQLSLLVDQQLEAVNHLKTEL